MGVLAKRIWGYPKSHLVNLGGGLRQCFSCCVKRVFLCGVDNQTGFNFDSKQWIEDRLIALSTDSPEDICSKAAEGGIISDDRDVSQLSLGYDHPVKWIAMFLFH